MDDFKIPKRKRPRTPTPPQQPLPYFKEIIRNNAFIHKYYKEKYNRDISTEEMQLFLKLATRPFIQGNESEIVDNNELFNDIVNSLQSLHRNVLYLASLRKLDSLRSMDKRDYTKNLFYEDRQYIKQLETDSLNNLLACRTEFKRFKLDHEFDFNDKSNEPKRIKRSTIIYYYFIKLRYNRVLIMINNTCIILYQKSIYIHGFKNQENVDELIKHIRVRDKFDEEKYPNYHLTITNHKSGFHYSITQKITGIKRNVYWFRDVNNVFELAITLLYAQKYIKIVKRQALTSKGQNYQFLPEIHRDIRIFLKDLLQLNNKIHVDVSLTGDATVQSTTDSPFIGDIYKNVLTHVTNIELKLLSKVNKSRTNILSKKNIT